MAKWLSNGRRMSAGMKRNQRIGVMSAAGGYSIFWRNVGSYVAWLGFGCRKRMPQ